MKFIPKKGLTEGMAANPLDKSVAEDQDVTAIAQQGILTAAAAETDAINQYMQILDLVDKSEPWLGNLAKTTLEDILNEEKKHLSQLSTITSKLPSFEKEFEAGKKEVETGKDVSLESVEESVNEKSPGAFTKFDLNEILNILEDHGIDEDRLEAIESDEAYGVYLYPEDVDRILTSLNFDSTTLDQIENEIIEKANFEKLYYNIQKDLRQMDWDSDIDILKSLINDPDSNNYIKSPVIRERIQALVGELETVEVE